MGQTLPHISTKSFSWWTIFATSMAFWGLLTVYTCIVHSVLQYATPVWHLEGQHPGVASSLLTLRLVFCGYYLMKLPVEDLWHSKVLVLLLSCALGLPTPLSILVRAFWTVVYILRFKMDITHHLKAHFIENVLNFFTCSNLLWRDHD
jgi:hypothetical protein